MGIPESRPDLYTYGDYLKWPADERWELIEGQAYAMTPAPSFEHQLLVTALVRDMAPYFIGKPCKLVVSPVDVRLPQTDQSDEAVDTVVQPDLLVICDPAKIDKKGVRGGPDLVVEVLSESTMHRDMDAKLRLYEKHGVRCYIIVDPWGKALTARYLDAPGQFGQPALFSGADRMPVRIFTGLEIDLQKLFAHQVS